jgi:hypothetical protein
VSHPVARCHTLFYPEIERHRREATNALLDLNLRSWLKAVRSHSRRGLAGTSTCRPSPGLLELPYINENFLMNRSRTGVGAKGTSRIQLDFNYAGTRYRPTIGSTD